MDFRSSGIPGGTRSRTSRRGAFGLPRSTCAAMGEARSPREITAYTLRHLASDVVAVIDQLGDGPAVLFGHDWGAPIVWHTALLHPDRIRAVAGLSVPFRPRGPAPFIEHGASHLQGAVLLSDLLSARGRRGGGAGSGHRGCAAQDLLRAVRDASHNTWLEPKPPEARLLDGLVDPQPFPGWMSESDLAVYVDAFRGRRLSRPAQPIPRADPRLRRSGRIERTRHYAAIGLHRRRARSCARLHPGRGPLRRAGNGLLRFPRLHHHPGIGHWVQQEAPKETNAALEAFVRGL